MNLWGDEGNVPTHWEDTQMYQDLAAIQSALFKFHETYAKTGFPNDEFVSAYERVDEAIQDMFGQIEGEI